MKLIQFIKNIFGIKPDTVLKPIDDVNKQPLKTLCDGVDVEFLDEEIICKFDCFAGKCWYVKTNAPTGIRPFRGEAYKSFILFNSPDTEIPDQISSVTIAVGDDGETYQIPNWTWDGMIELNYDNYKYVDMLNTVSNERVIEADFSLIDKIKTKARELYGDIIGKLYTNDDLYTAYGSVIRKYTVVVKNKLTEEIVLFKTFDAFADAQYFYDKLLKI